MNNDERKNAMADYIDLQVQKLGDGVCQKCGKSFNELNYATLISSNKTKSYVLCNDCLLQLQIKTDNFNADHQANNTEKSHMKVSLTMKSTNRLKTVFKI